MGDDGMVEGEVVGLRISAAGVHSNEAASDDEADTGLECDNVNFVESGSDDWKSVQTSENESFVETEAGDEERAEETAANQSSELIGCVWPPPWWVSRPAPISRTA